MATETETTDTTTTETTDTSTETVEQQSTDTATDDKGVDDASKADATDSTEGDDDEGTVLGGKEDADEDGDDAAEDDKGSGPPETYELSLKDADGNDIALDEASVEQASEVFRELGLDNEQANKLLPVASDLVNRTSENVLKQVSDLGAQQRKDWLAEAKADEVLGGANWKASLEQAGVGMDAMGFPEGHEFRTLLNETGLGNNKHMIAVFRQLGEIAGEDGTFARSEAASETKAVGWADRYKDNN